MTVAAAGRLFPVPCPVQQPWLAVLLAGGWVLFAEMAGLTIETTVRLLKDFEERDVLRKKEKDLLILSEERLRALAGSAS